MIGTISIDVREDVERRLFEGRNDRDEVETAIRWFVGMHNTGVPWRDMLLIAPGKRKWRERIAAATLLQGVPCRLLLGEPGMLPDPSSDVIHAASMYGAEGLAMPVVAFVGLGDLPWKRQPLDEARRIVRASAQVATRYLWMSRSRASALADPLFTASDATRLDPATDSPP